MQDWDLKGVPAVDLMGQDYRNGGDVPFIKLIPSTGTAINVELNDVRDTDSPKMVRVAPLASPLASVSHAVSRIPT